MSGFDERLELWRTGGYGARAGATSAELLRCIRAIAEESRNLELVDGDEQGAELFDRLLERVRFLQTIHADIGAPTSSRFMDAMGFVLSGRVPEVTS